MDIELIEASERTLSSTPERVTRFLGAVNRNRSIRAALLTRGFNKARRQEGWALLKAVLGQVEDDAVDPAEAEQQRLFGATVVSLDQWDEPNFRIIDAALEFSHPEQRAYLFRNNLKPSTGVAAAVAVSTLIERVYALRDGTDGTRDQKRAADKAAIQKLAERGYTDEVWAELEAKAKQVTSEVEDLPVVEEAPSEAEDAALKQLYAWYKEWSTIAHAVIRRQDQLIQLGLARPKKKSEKKGQG